jgi:hypothetical protein
MKNQKNYGRVCEDNPIRQEKIGNKNNR